LYITSLPPPHLNLTLFALVAEQTQPRTKSIETQSTIKYTEAQNKTQIYTN